MPAEMSLPPTPLTLDGSYLLHQMFRVRWAAWRGLGATEQKHILDHCIKRLAALEENKQEATGLVSLLGHKGDLMLIHFRKTLDDLNQAELLIAQLPVQDFLEPTTSYVSVVELGIYEASVKLYSELIGKGLSTRQIAQKLHLGVPTIETYRARIKDKLNLKDALALLQYAIRWNIGNSHS